MGKWKIVALTLGAAGLGLLMSGCGVVDDTILNSPADTSVQINVPYATATPLPENMAAPEAIVIDSEGNVTLNDSSVIEGDFQSTVQQAAQTEYRSLSLGSTGIAVQALQLRLRDLGYFHGEVSGLFDSDTEAAVKRFEQTYGTMQTGVATTKLQLKLFASNAPAYGTDAYNNAVISQYAVLRPGTVGSAVYALQQRLKNLGYPITELTGVYDAETAQSVRLFYANYGLASSDVANVAMQRELYADTARAYDPSVQVVATLSPEALLQQYSVVMPTSGEADDASAIALGNSGPRISQIQQRLIALGYLDSGADTGVFDQSTQEAVNRFLSAVGRLPNGILTSDMQEFLLSDSAPVYGGATVATQYRDLNVGDSGEEVFNLQRRLVELGYAKGTPNGDYGKATFDAVVFYQQLNDLETTGIATAWLQSLLFSNSALTYEQVQMNASKGFTSTADASGGATGEDTSQQDTTDALSDTLYFNLVSGSRGSAVTALQNRLIELGYLDSASGLYDDATRNAVTAFQNAIGVPATGEASASMQRYIYSKAAPDASVRFEGSGEVYADLRPGDTGDAVTALQRRLWELGLLNRADIEDSVGAYNEATRLAVTTAQLKMGYGSADGIAGAEFQNFLFSKYGDKLAEKKKKK